MTPQDVKSVGQDVLRHRIKLHYEALAQDRDADGLIESLLQFTPRP